MLLSPLKSLVLTTGTAAFLFGSLAPARAFEIYTNRTAWENRALSINGNQIVTDSFSTNIPAPIAPNSSITLFSSILPPGIVSTNSTPPPVGINFNSVSGGTYLNAVNNAGTDASRTITWAFSTSTFAFGADYNNLFPGALTLTGNFDGIGNQTVTLTNELGGSTNGFVGIVGAANFNSLVFGNNLNVQEIFNMDNASFVVGTSPVPPPTGVPEPGTVVGLAFLGGGLLLGRLGKRR